MKLLESYSFRTITPLQILHSSWVAVESRRHNTDTYDPVRAFRPWLLFRLNVLGLHNMFHLVKRMLISNFWFVVVFLVGLTEVIVLVIYVNFIISEILVERSSYRWPISFQLRVDKQSSKTEWPNICWDFRNQSGVFQDPLS